MRLDDQVLNRYRAIDLGRNPTCLACRAAQPPDAGLSRPVSLWHVGEAYRDDPRRILFVGKTARNEPGVPDGAFLDARAVADGLYAREPWPYWRYTRDIAARVFGSPEAGWARIAFTNLVKCNGSGTVDRTTDLTKQACVADLGVFWEELAILRPRHVVLYTHWAYDDVLRADRWGAPLRDVTPATLAVPIGKRARLAWWERASADGTLRVLRTSHPERKPKEAFVGRIADWLSQPAVVRI